MGKHKEWRKIAKKARRKKIRQELAKQRNLIEEEARKKRESSPSYQEELDRMKREEELERKMARERELEWQRVEIEAQKQFKELQRKIALAKEERAKQNELIKLEWQREQEKIKQTEEKERRELEEKLKEQERLNKSVEDFLEYGGDTPDHLKTILETNPSKEACPFFEKTSTCRFSDHCSRNHRKPAVSKIILIPNFFAHYSLEKSANDESGDSSLEFEHGETRQSYREFFYDVIPEFEKHGRVKLVKTCCNQEVHLRGNVFVEYSNCRGAMKCVRALNGRWYAGKQLSIEFCNIKSWNDAVCGLHIKRKCPRGNTCNFLHTFVNPNNLYDFEIHSGRILIRNERLKRSRSKSWRWSESPERWPLIEDKKHSKCSKSKKHKRNRSRSGSRSKRIRSKS